VVRPQLSVVRSAVPLDRHAVPILTSVFSLGISPLSSLSRVLCLGAHCDDIEIGCAGTLLMLRRLNPDVSIRMVVFSGAAERVEEARKSVEALCGDSNGFNLTVKGFRDSYFPFQGQEIKECFGELCAEPDPELIFTHYRNDLHQDHRLVSELTWNTFRDHCILEYEIPKYDGDLGVPNVFVHLDERTCDQKIAHICRSFPTQLTKPWFSPETFRATLRLRGIESRSPYGYAEGFYGRKLILASPASPDSGSMSR
jgi:LmbE family N-acetylglucosaminyl deacetylase